MRQRSQTIGVLGRTPARAPQSTPSAGPPLLPEAPRRGVRAWLRGALLDNLPVKVLSLVLAITVFLLVNTDEQREINVLVGVAYDYPADQYVLTSKPIAEARVTIRGPWRRLRNFDERELSRILLDLRSTPNGDLPLTPALIENVPPRLRVIAVSPRTVHVTFDRLVTKTVTIVPVTDGKLDRGYTLADVRAIPSTVRVRGGEHALAGLRSVPTFPVALAGHPATFDAAPPIDAPDGVTLDAGQVAMVRVRIEEVVTTRTVQDLPVVPAAPTDPGAPSIRWAISPTTIDVVLTGGGITIERALPKLRAIVELDHSASADGAKSREAAVRLDGLPDGLTARLTPDHVKLTPAAARTP